MKKIELEIKILELEKKIQELQNRPICLGHYHYCYHCTPNTHTIPNTPVPYYGPGISSPNICGTNGNSLPSGVTTIN